MYCHILDESNSNIVIIGEFLKILLYPGGGNDNIVMYWMRVIEIDVKCWMRIMVISYTLEESND